MAGEVTIAREGKVDSLNAVGSTSSARRQSNPFRGITNRPVSDAYLAELEEQGVNMRIYESLRRDERDRRIDYEYENQVRNLRDSLREKYPLGNYDNTAFTTDRGLLAQAKAERAAYNRELNRGVRRLKRLAAAAKKK